jgi:hypothetical protein
MRHARVLQTNIGKPSSRVIVSDFVYNTRADSIKFLKQCLDVTGCEDVFDDPNTMSQLEGRARLVCNTITKINDTPSKTKSQVLRAAINETYEKHLTDGVVAATEKLKNKKNATLLLKSMEMAAIACCTDDTSVFEASEKIDLMETGICHIRKAQGSEKYYYVVQEPLTADIIAAILDEYKSSASNQLLVRWANQMVRQRDPQARGKLFEKLCSAAMLQPGTVLRLIRNCDVYDRSGVPLSKQEKNKLEDGLGALQFQKAQTYRASDMNTNNNPTILNLYRMLPSLGEGNGEIRYNDQNFGPDFAGVGVVSNRYYAVAGTCKFIPSNTKLTEYSVTNDLTVMSCHYWNTGRNAEQFVKEKRKELTGYKVNASRLAFDITPKPWDMYEEHIAEFNQIYTTIEKALLLSCTLPRRRVAVEFSKLKENELMILIGKENFHHLIGDEQVVKVISAILDKQEVTSIENNIISIGEELAGVTEVTGKRSIEAISADDQDSVTDESTKKRTSTSYIITY